MSVNRIDGVHKEININVWGIETIFCETLVVEGFCKSDMLVLGVDFGVLGRDHTSALCGL